MKVLMNSMDLNSICFNMMVFRSRVLVRSVFSNLILDTQIKSALYHWDCKSSVTTKGVSDHVHLMHSTWFKILILEMHAR